MVAYSQQIMEEEIGKLDSNKYNLTLAGNSTSLIFNKQSKHSLQTYLQIDISNAPLRIPLTNYIPFYTLERIIENLSSNNFEIELYSEERQPKNKNNISVITKYNSQTKLSKTELGKIILSRYKYFYEYKLMQVINHNMKKELREQFMINFNESAQIELEYIDKLCNPPENWKPDDAHKELFFNSWTAISTKLYIDRPLFFPSHIKYVESHCRLAALSNISWRIILELSTAYKENIEKDIQVYGKTDKKSKMLLDYYEIYQEISETAQLVYTNYKYFFRYKEPIYSLMGINTFNDGFDSIHKKFMERVNKHPIDRSIILV